MGKHRCIIIEDEPLALERTKGFVAKIPFLQLLSAFDNAMEGLAFLKSNPVDVLFLDINMDELSGIELLESTKLNCQVILTTAYSEYALKGYDLRVTDYLLKPFSFERFLQAVDKLQDKKTDGAATASNFIFVKTENRLEKVNLEDILFIEGMRDYRRIHTVHKRIMTLQTFKDFELEISPQQICRVHKSYMVALDKIDSLERDRIKIKDRLIPVSDTYKKEFLERIHQSRK